VTQSYVFAGVGGYYGGNEGNLAGVFRRKADSAGWTHVLTEPEAYTVFVHPRDPSLVLAGTKNGIYQSTDGGASFKRANFPDSGVQIWSFLADPADTKQILAGGSPVSCTGSRGSSKRALTPARAAATTVQISTEATGARSITAPMATLPNT